jgi:dTDP-4-dehydrorhamnose 3,5-epimerase-like enzyme
MNQDRIIRPSFTRNDERGLLRELLNEGEWRSVVTGEMVVGSRMGNHYHKETLVFFFLLTGHAAVILEDIETGARSTLELNALEGIIFQTNESHVLTFTEHTAYLMLKSLPYDPANPDTFDHPLI